MSKKAGHLTENEEGSDIDSSVEEEDSSADIDSDNDAKMKPPQKKHHSPIKKSSPKKEVKNESLTNDIVVIPY